MDEKILIKGEPYQTRKVLKKIAFWLAILIVVSFTLILPAIEGVVEYNSYIDYGWHRNDDCSVGAHIMSNYSEYYDPIWPMLVVIPFFVGCAHIIIGVIALFLRSGEITVTDKRVYGVCGFKRVDLPLDSISAVSSTGKAISVSTSSGRISFRMLKNAETVYDVINKLLLERQEQKKNAEPAPAAVVNAPTKAAELKEYKELLDSGIITPEEFDAKKKELLGL